MNKVLSKIFIGRERHKLLEKYNWYLNLHGGYTHPHLMDFMTRREILSYTPEQLEYLLEHGSLATLPAELRNKERK